MKDVTLNRRIHAPVCVCYIMSISYFEINENKENCPVLSCRGSINRNESDVIPRCFSSNTPRIVTASWSVDRKWFPGATQPCTARRKGTWGTQGDVRSRNCLRKRGRDGSFQSDQKSIHAVLFLSNRFLIPGFIPSTYTLERRYTPPLKGTQKRREICRTVRSRPPPRRVGSCAGLLLKPKDQPWHG